MIHGDKPETLDIVKIDGRWAQVCSSRLIRYLDDRSFAEIDWDHYREVRKYSCMVGHAIQDGLDVFSPSEFASIYWGSDRPELKNLVYVFAEYVTKADLLGLAETP